MTRVTSHPPWRVFRKTFSVKTHKRYYYVCDLSYFDVVLCPSSSQIPAISFSRKLRPPQCSLASLARVSTKVTPLKNPRSANDWQHAQPQNLRVLGEENRIPVLLSYYWYCPRSMHVYVTVRCPSVCLSHSPAAAACGRFAAVGPAGRRYQSIAARPVPRKHGAAAANAGSVTFTADVRR